MSARRRRAAEVMGGALGAPMSDAEVEAVIARSSPALIAELIANPPPPLVTVANDPAKGTPTVSPTDPTPTPTPISAPAPAAPSAPVPGGPATGTGIGNGTGSGRLPNGELRRRVAEVLRDRCNADLTASEIAGLLGHSSGAIANALVTLVARGEAEHTVHRPDRYRANPATTIAATPAPGVSASRTGAGSGSGSRGGPRRSSRSRTTASGGTGTSTATGPSTTPATTPSTAPGASSATPPAGASGGGKVVSGPVARPNGQMYHPRTLSGMPDVTALRRLRTAGVPALLYGPPGTGKTSVIEAAFPDLITVPGDGDTTVADFVGEYTQTPDGRFEFVHGPLIRAMREGRVLFIDDATLIPPTVLAAVYPAMDGRRQIVVKSHGGETVDAADGFYVVAGHNPGVHGAILSDALASRFSAQIQVSTDFDLATALGIDRRVVKIARQLARRQHDGEIGWAPQLRELIAFDRIAAVLGPEAAAGNLVGTAPEDDRDIVATVTRSVFGTEVTPLALCHRI